MSAPRPPRRAGGGRLRSAPPRRSSLAGVVQDPVAYRKRTHTFGKRRGVPVAWVVASVTLAAACGLGALGWRLTARDDARKASAAATPSVAATASAAATGSADASPTASAAATRTTSPTITIAAVGDMMFERSVKTLVKAQGGAAALSDVAPRLMAADLTVGNLESPLSSRGTKVPNKSYTFQGTPLGADALASAGFDVVSVANNHVLDFGPVALSDTLANLDAKQIAYAGAGRTRTDAWRAATVDAAGNSVACLAFSDIVPPGFAADADSPGIADSRKTMDEVLTAVTAAAASHDFVLVSMHWGDEYQYDANDEQVRDAHRLVNAGADMVLAHHPHVIQGIERYKGALIAYSLGDFVFDHDLRSTGESFILEAELGPAGVGEATCTPIYCSDTNGRPEYIHGKEAAVVTKRVRTLSKRLGTKVTVVGDVARVER